MSKYKAFISVHSVHSSEAGGKEIAVLNLVANFGCGMNTGRLAAYEIRLFSNVATQRHGN
jgi:hypothetical protein